MSSPSGERIDLHLRRFAALLFEGGVVGRVRVKRRVEIDKIDTRILELFRVPQPSEIVAEIEPIHSLNFIASRSDGLAGYIASTARR